MSAKRKLSKTTDVNKLKEPDKVESYPVFCFKHLTTNKKYNIEYFKKKNVREKSKAYGALFFLINDMQNSGWKDLFSRSKEIGFESIQSKQLKLQPKNLSLSPDSKVLCIRFKKQTYRMLGIKNKDVFHVIGFDFDYSAYNHGK